MALLYSLPLSSTFAGVTQLQANGTLDTGDNSPNGIGTSLYIENGHMVSRQRETDALTASGKRSEIIPGLNADLGDERWYTWEWMAPSWPMNDACSGNKLFEIMQIHDASGPARSPPFGIWYDGVSVMASVPAYTPPTENVAYKYPGGIALAQGVWHSFALHALWSNATAGLLELYINRYPVFKVKNTGTAYNADSPYLKLGTYNYQGLTGYTERVLYYRNIKVYSTGDALTTILGGQSICRSFSVR